MIAEDNIRKIYEFYHGPFIEEKHHPIVATQKD
jgi:hypothetical protein